MAGQVNVEVLFFASLREAIGRTSIDLHLPVEATRKDLLTHLRNEFGDDRVAPLLAENVSIAVNRTLEKGAFVLKPGDEVAFLPPITGG